MNARVLINESDLRLAIAEWMSICSSHGWDPLHLSGHASLIKMIASLDEREKKHSEDIEDFNPYNTVNS